MANELVGQCWLIDFPTAAMRLVALKLCDCAEPDGTSIYPSVATIADETNVSTSAVRAALAAFRQAGLLIDKDNGSGNRTGRTTVLREIDIDLLRLITGRRKKGMPKLKSTHILAEVEVSVVAEATTVTAPGAAAPSLVTMHPDFRVMTVWAIVPRPATPPAPGGVVIDGAPPGAGGVGVQEPEGGPSSSGTPPLQEPEGAPPGAGANPLIDPEGSRPFPPTPRRGREGSPTDFEEVFAAMLIGKAHRQPIIDRIIRPLVAARTFESSMPGFALGQLADWAAELKLSDTQAADVVQHVKDRRKFTFQCGHLEDALQAVRGKPREKASAPKAATRAPKDRTVAACWPRMREALINALGRDVVDAWFSEAGLDCLSDGVLVLAAGKPFLANYIRQHFTGAVFHAAKKTDFADARKVLVIPDAIETPAPEAVS